MPIHTRRDLHEPPSPIDPRAAADQPFTSGSLEPARVSGLLEESEIHAKPFSRAQELSLRVLLIEDNPGDARLVQEILIDTGAVGFDVVHVDRLSHALESLARESFDAVLLDLGLPDAHGLEAMTPLTNSAPGVPIVVLSGLEDESVAVQAVQLGAQDYLVKGHNTSFLPRAIRYAIERKRSEEMISHVANHDSLTNLPNRRLLLDRLNQAVARARRARNMLALLFLDIDHFKNINDTLGHSFGDLLLQGVAKRLRACTRASDTISRLGGDEFTIVLPDVSHLEDVSAFAEKIRDALKPRFLLAGNELFVSASIGVSSYPNDGEDAESLLRHADAAMYRAKQQGRNTYQFYSPSISGPSSERLAMCVALRHAVDREEFSLHYQPQIDLFRGKIVGVEALLRWDNEELGTVAPSRFIPVAEETGLIVSIGEWALGKACAQARAWQDAGMPPLRVAVNISSHQFNRGNLLSTIVAALHQSRLHPRYLELELTESGLMNNEPAAIATLKQLKSTGLRLTIDDFGTGYSSLNHLKRFPIDALKIDQSFVRDMTSDPHDAAIVKAIIAMGHGLGMEVVAEGVETARQVAFLRKYRCDHTQGYFFSYPLPPDDLAALLWEGHARFDG